MYDLQKFQAKACLCKFFCFLFRIHGHEIFVEVDSYTRQCLARVLVNGTNVFYKEVQWVNASG